MLEIAVAYVLDGGGWWALGGAVATMTKDQKAEGCSVGGESVASNRRSGPARRWVEN